LPQHRLAAFGVAILPRRDVARHLHRLVADDDVDRKGAARLAAALAAMANGDGERIARQTVPDGAAIAAAFDFGHRSLSRFVFRACAFI
jgi:hypothetical protein